MQVLKRFGPCRDGLPFSTNAERSKRRFSLNQNVHREAILLTRTTSIKTHAHVLAWHGFVMLNCPLLELQLTVVVPEAVYPGAHVKVHCAAVVAVDAASQLLVL